MQVNYYYYFYYYFVAIAAVPVQGKLITVLSVKHGSGFRENLQAGRRQKKLFPAFSGRIADPAIGRFDNPA